MAARAAQEEERRVRTCYHLLPSHQKDNQKKVEKIFYLPAPATTAGIVYERSKGDIVSIFV